ncbi:MAG: redoxin domain-containing protein [Candidatus Krumholzibacteria bacterium]|nr:redoxin domain-containing protein [Candidatus Krumholzibacteria bacterium]
MKIFRRVLALAWMMVAALLLVPVSGAAPGKRVSNGAIRGDSSALAIYTAMNGALRDARSLSYESEYVWMTDGREIGRSNYRMWLKKPNFARLESSSMDGRKTGVLVLDGRRMWIFWPNGRPYIHETDSTSNARDCMRSYILKDAPAGSLSIARETSVFGTGMSMMILDPSIFHGSSDLVDELLEEVTITGSGSADGEACDVIEATYAKGQRTRVFWVSRRDHLPRRLEETVRVKREIAVQESWRAVVVNGAIPKETFLWKPPVGWTEYRLQELGDGLLKLGGEAPDFAFELLDGSAFRLSEHRGEVVWLSFWRLSCVPCRNELVQLQKLHNKHAGDGLVVLGFNCSDGRAAAKEFLGEKAIGFPNIADTTAAAREVLYEKYQTPNGQSALPLNYIIDRQGRIAARWYGYRRGDNRGEKILRNLGVGN